MDLAYNNINPIEHIIGMLEGIIGAIATGLVLYQLKLSEETERHQDSIEEASFILEYNKSFIQDANMTNVEHLLENQAFYDDKPKMIITSENRQQFVNYLVYLEGLAPLILLNILSLQHIDDLMAYRFFLAVDNVEVQENQLIPYAEYYRGCYKLYKVWKAYREDNELSFPVSDCKNTTTMRSLSSLDIYRKYSEA